MTNRGKKMRTITRGAVKICMTMKTTKKSGATDDPDDSTQ